MEELISELERLTENIVMSIDAADIAQMLDFVRQREELIEQIKAIGVSNEHQVRYVQRIEQLMSHDSIIVKKMNDYQNEATENLQKIRNARKQVNAYHKSYTLDGVFFDKKLK